MNDHSKQESLVSPPLPEAVREQIARIFGQGYCDDDRLNAYELARVVWEAAAQQERTIACPLCGIVVTQVASAALSLALWQHVNWVCPKSAPHQKAASHPPPTEDR